MAFEKPGWLRDWLSHLNWDILTWHVYVGDAIESGIDWVLDIINNIAEWAAAIGAWWDDFRQEVLDLFATIGESIGGWVNQILDWIEGWGDRIGDWWAATQENVKDWISIAAAWLSDRIDWLQGIVDTISVWWNTFVTETLPLLASKFDIIDAFNEFMLTWKDLFTWWEDFKDDIMNFITDPIEWLWSKFTDWFLGKE